MMEIAASALVKLAVRFHRLLTACTVSPVKGQKNPADSLMLLLTAPLGAAAVDSDDDTVTAAWSRSIMDYLLDEIALLAGGSMGLALVERQSRSTTLSIASSLVAWNKHHGEYRGVEEEKGSAVEMSQLLRQQTLGHDTSCWCISGGRRNKEFGSSSVLQILWPVLLALSSPPSTPVKTADSGLALMDSMSLTGSSSAEKQRRRERERDEETEREREKERESRALMVLERPRAAVKVTTRRLSNIIPLTKYDKDVVPTPDITPTKSLKDRDIRRDSSGTSSNSIFGFTDSFSATTTAEPFSPSKSPASGPQLDFLTTPPASRKSSLNKPETRDSFDAFKGHDFTKANGKESNNASSGQTSTSILSLDWLQDTRVKSKDDQVVKDGPVISHSDEFEGFRASGSPLTSLFGPSVKSLALPAESEGEVDGFRGPRSPVASVFAPTVVPPAVSDTARPVISRFSLKSTTLPPPVAQTQTQSQKIPEFQASFDNLMLVNPPLEIQVPFPQARSPGAGSGTSNPPFSPTVNIADDLVASFQPSLSPRPPLTINADSRDLDFLFKDKATPVTPPARGGLNAPLSAPQAAGRGVAKSLKPPPISVAKKTTRSPRGNLIPDIMNDKPLSPFDVPSPFLPSTDLNAVKAVDPFAPSVSSFTASVSDMIPKSSSVPFTASVADPFATAFTPSTATTPAVFATTMPQYPYPYPGYGPDPRQYYPPGPYGAAAQYPNPYPYPYQGGGYAPPGAPYSVPPGVQWQQPLPPGVPVVPITGAPSSGVQGGTGAGSPEIAALNPFDQFLRK